MPRSMTGYGTAEGPLGGGRLTIEVKTVNHRHLNVQLRLPTALQPIEADLRNRLRERLERGHVSLTARWTEAPTAATTVKVDVERARAIVRAVQELQTALDLAGDVGLEFVARQPEVLSTGEPEAAPIEVPGTVTLLDRALDALDQMRQREGAALTVELRRLLDGIAERLRAVEAVAPRRLTAERERLRRSVSELLEGRRLEEDRLAVEIALLADKLDIREEIVRLRTHLEACGALLQGDGPVGRQLTFLGQEMLREINTIGSKANDATIAEAVVGMKGDLEKLREQVENLE